MPLLGLGEIHLFYLSQFVVPMTWPKRGNWLLSRNSLPTYAW